MELREPIKTEKLTRGQNVVLGRNVRIEAKNVFLGDNVVINDNVRIKCLGDFRLGRFSVLGENNKISCNNFSAGEWLYTTDGFEVGRGGCFNPTANVVIGDRVGIFERTVINPNSEVTIGDNTGIGAEVMIWTHGAWLDVYEGFPAGFGPVKIGKNVWLPARCVVLPGVEIGDNCVIGINTLVNKNIPSGAMAAGMPVKMIKENYYPRKLSEQEKIDLLNGIIKDWAELISFKLQEKLNFEIVTDGLNIKLIQSGNESVFDTARKTFHGYSNHISEDLRDYLRRRGIKIFTDSFFKTIQHKP